MYYTKKFLRKILRILLVLLSCFLIFVVPAGANEFVTDDDPVPHEHVDPLASTWDNYLIAFDSGGSPLGQTDTKSFPYALTKDNVKELHFNYNLKDSKSKNFNIDLSFTCYKQANIIPMPKVKILFYNNNDYSGSITISPDDFTSVNESHRLSKSYTAPESFDYVSIYFIYDQPYSGTFILKNLNISADDTSILNNIIDVIKNIPSAIIDGISSFFNMLADVISSCASFIVDGIGSVIDTLRYALVSVINTLISTVERIQSWLLDLGLFIIDGLKELFLTDGDFIRDWFIKLGVTVKGQLGFLVYPFELFVNIMKRFTNVSFGSGVINIPDLVVGDYILIYAQTFDLKGIMSSVLGKYYDLYYAFVDVIIILLFSRAIYSKYRDFFGAGGDK